MTLEEARKLIQNPASPMFARIEASAALSLSADATLDHLVGCLRHRGVVAELAAATLYRRTGRPRPKRIRDFANPDQWEQFLIRRRLESEANGNP